MLEYHHTKRRPSKLQIKADIRKGLQTSDWVAVHWGENRIVVERLAIYSHSRSLSGSGWIGKNGGDDIARELLKEGLQ